MLDERQIRLLELLEDQINKCDHCFSLYKRKCLPYWTPLSKYLIIGEFPDIKDVGNEPFIGYAGGILWAIMDKYALRKEEFAIINSIQCRPVPEVGANGKPTVSNMIRCRPWIRKFIRILEPHKALVLGNYAKAVSEDSNSVSDISGIMKMNGIYRINSVYVHSLPTVYSVHPSICIKKVHPSMGGAVEGEKLLEISIKVFKEL